jgi:hypothetical protein
MPLEQESHPLIVLETKQDDDIFSRQSAKNRLAMRLYSMRSREAQSQGLLNQDYALICSQADGQSLSFCVCDGVGSSYRGDVAARYLGEHLVTWLQSLPDLHIESSVCATLLNDQFSLWAQDAQAQLLQMPLPQDASILVKEVIQELRNGYGSETVFLGGRIDLDVTDQGMSRGAHVLLCWMGNVTAHVFVENGHFWTLGSDSDWVARWSTVSGGRGSVSIWHMHLSALEKLLVHTDGLDQVSLLLHDLDDAGWREQAQQLLQLPRNDDMTALELCWNL